MSIPELNTWTLQLLSNKSIQLHTDQEAELDLDTTLSLKSSNTSWGFLVGSHWNTEMKWKIFQHLFVLLSQSFPLLVVGFTGLLDIASAACGVLLYLPSVLTVCTCSGQGAGLVGSLGQMYCGIRPPTQSLRAFFFLALSVSLPFYIPSRWQVCFTSLAKMIRYLLFVFDERVSWQLSKAANVRDADMRNYMCKRLRGLRRNRF